MTYALTDEGCTVTVETADDIPALRSLVNFDCHPCEWAERIGDDVSALFVMNNSYTIKVTMPLSLAPDAIKNEMED